MKREDCVGLAALGALVHVVVVPGWPSVAALTLAAGCLLGVLALQVLAERWAAHRSAVQAELASQQEALAGRLAALEAAQKRTAERVDSLSQAPRSQRPQL